MTESEKLFEEIFSEKEIYFRRVPTSSPRTPDYQVIVNDSYSYWEVKELEKNDDEAKILNQQKPEIYSVDSTRVENSIKSACGQFKDYKVTNYPCVVVLYDSREFEIMDVLFHQFVQTAMLGKAEYMHQKDGSLVEIKRNHGLLTKRKRYISAVAVMHQKTRKMVFYHNPNANIPLVSSDLLKKFEDQFQAVFKEKRLEWIRV